MIPTKRFRDREIGGGARSVGTSKEELEPGSAWAVTHTNSAGKLDTIVVFRYRHTYDFMRLQVTRSESVLGNEGLLFVDDLIYALIGMIVNLGVVEDDN